MGETVLTLSAEQVRTLAPDASAARAGEALGTARRWTSTGRSESAAWGLCQGSGSNPYQVVVDMIGPAYKCSCPSRKIPCKHSLGLLFLVADTGAPTADPPEWVQTWLDSRTSRAAAAATRADRASEVDPEARARRVATRERKVAAGIEELDRWLRDLARRGLDSTRAEGYRFWDTMGARLVDAQAGGLGRSVRGLGSAANSGDAWPHLLLEGVGRLHLLSEAYRHADRLPADLQADVRSLVGWTVREEELDPANAVEDRWLVVGRRVDDRGDIVTARTVLLGEASERVALHLAFGVGMAPPTVLALPGQAFRATLTFYPSSTPLRAAIQVPLVPDGEVVAIPGAASVSSVVADHAARLARNPFAGAWPVVIGGVVPARRNDRLLVRDTTGASLPISDPEVAPRLLAVSGGHPITLIAEWDGSWLRPMGTFADGHVADVSSDSEFPPPRIDDPDWSELLSAALLGTERTGGAARTPDSVAGLVADDDPERAILAAAAGMAVRRRAGAPITLDDGPREPHSATDPRPVLPGHAARFVALAFEDRPSLIPELLTLVSKSGRRLPDEWLPDLLTLAARSNDDDMAWADIGGPRAAWLAAALPELAGDIWWGAGGDRDRDWDAAGPRQRLSLLRRARRAEPAAARALLERRWKDVAADDRGRMLAALDVGIGQGDEPFLRQAFTDRRADVRRVAARLLATLPGSDLAKRLEAELRPLVTTTGRVRKSLKLTLPEPTEEVEALVPPGRPASGYGERAWLLRTLIAHVGPSRWVEWLQADPASLVDRAVRSDEARPLLEGWIEATARFADPDWATALLANPDVAPKVSANREQLVEGLPLGERAKVAVAAAAADGIDPSVLAGIVRSVPVPWPRPLADAVLARAQALKGDPLGTQAFYVLVRASALGLPPDRADDLEEIASHNGDIRPGLVDAIETIGLRARMREAFAALPPLQPTQP